MLWFFLALLALYAVFLEAALQVDLHRTDTTHLLLRLRIAGLRKTWYFKLVKTVGGHRLLLVSDPDSRPVDTAQMRQGRGRSIVRALLSSDKARQFLLSHIRVDRLDSLILLRTEAASHTALLSGFIQGLLACIPVFRRRNVRIRVLPDFFRPHSTVKARCIIRFRLGTIILTAWMLLAAHLRQRRLTESEAMTYGSSHR